MKKKAFLGEESVVDKGISLKPSESNTNENITVESIYVTNLKYTRRSKRTINNNTYILSQPDAKVSNAMQKIKSSNTSIELLLEEKLKEHKINYTRPQQLIEPVEGNPDFVVPRYRIAIFCDGDFWHGYQLDNVAPKKNSEFWRAKIENNIQRDKKVNTILKEKEWNVFRFWEHEIKKSPDACVLKIKSYIESILPTSSPEFTFVDLFAGVGGFRIALEELGGKCLGFSEIDKPASEVYKSNFCDFLHDDEKELGDITKLGKLPFENIDLIVGGVPCQSWSVAGKMRGFEDPRGRLWNDTLRVVEMNKPKAFIFENVKGLMDPRNEANLELIKSSFRKAGYSLQAKLLNSYDFGLPQNRDRIFIVGIRNDIVEHLQPFHFPEPVESKFLLRNIIENLNDAHPISKKVFIPSDIFGDKVPMGRNRFQKTDELNDFFIFCDTRNGHSTIHSWDIIRTSSREKEICMTILRNRRKKIYGSADGNPLSFNVLSELIPNLKVTELEKLVDKKILRLVPNAGYEFVNSKNSAGINGLYRVYLPHSHIFSTLTATGTKDVIALKSVQGSTPEEYRQNFIDQIVKKKLYRSITGKESGRLQGFPSWFSIHKDDNLAKKQFGNAVSTWVIYHLGLSLLETRIFSKIEMPSRLTK
jgi:DNA (cytosine-5)-methyltransferase 1